MYTYKVTLCPTVTKIICKPRKNAQNRMVFQNRYHLSEAIRKILIHSDKCSINVSGSGVHLSILMQKVPFVRYYPKNLDTSGQMGLNMQGVTLTSTHQHLSAVLHSCNGVP